MVGEEPWFAPNLDKKHNTKVSLSIYQSPSSRYYRHVFLPICLELPHINRNRERPFFDIHHRYGGSVLISLSSRRSSCESEQCYWRRRWWLAPGSAKMRRRFSNAKTVTLVKKVLPFFFFFLTQLVFFITKSRTIFELIWILGFRESTGGLASFVVQQIPFAGDSKETAAAADTPCLWPNRCSHFQLLRCY